ncbi:acyltransferase [Ponticaulis sp.]|uniref:acyltransferase family protein n=1 Tax=Ponticaulis sp. TaxID=2020902 RepID=UPI000B63C971|nr:acyltransferase [Ponticaulis sp.]MAI90449.1 hypothetical protein [Ponticaulis sp.]OUY00148.1 MAG: hypothetical protein CBB65_08420 [Hyphomonadaceae bacterium TMED5]|tara:strand:+ start:64595 stop:67069 length:2475 start_codon:yes stop_codon:yes gene_type:complete
MAGMRYRFDIDGMRAIAVIAVVLFHLDIHALAGGFVGVDVFFVISGFLITSIIWGKKQKDSFKLSDFYLGRIRRLFPALYVTVIATFIAAAFILSPFDFAAFAKSAIASLFSVSNILFYSEAGYWDTSSDMKPLLHTWSLGVEEQFYLFWPLFVVMCATWLKKIPFILMLLGVTLISFFVTLWFTGVDTSAAFYLFPFRIFQFSAGAVIAFGVRHALVAAPLKSAIVRDVLMLAGLVITIACVFLFGDETLFPGWNAVPPTVGALLLLYAGCGENGQGPLGRAILTNPVSLFFGRISYALYLVHWPVIVLYRYETGLDFNVLEQVGMFVVMLALAVGVHYGVERRFYRRDHSVREGKALSQGGFAWRTIAIGFVMSAVAGHAVMSSGWVWRFPNIMLTPDQIREGQQLRFVNFRAECNVADFPDGEACQPESPDARNVLFLGNSHEPDAYNFISAGYGDDPTLNFITFGQINRCQNQRREAQGWRTDNADCQARLDALFDPEFVNQLDVVVYGANKPFDPNKNTLFTMMADLKDIHEGELPIILYGGYINTNVPCSRIIEETGSTDGCNDAENVSYFETDPTNEAMYAEMMSLTDFYVDRIEVNCPGRELAACETQTPDGVPYAYDEHHLSLEFAEYAGRQYAAIHPNLFDDVLSGDVSQPDIEIEVVDPADLPAVSEANQAGLLTILGEAAAFQRERPVEVSEYEGGYLLRRNNRQFNEDRVGGNTGVAHIELTGEREAALSGHSVHITVSGIARDATPVWLQYSTNERGHSGWVEFEVEAGEFTLEMDYDVPEMNYGRGDYFGVIPFDAHILIQDVSFEITD